MDLHGRVVALYGRFSPGARDRLQKLVALGGGSVVRDLTRRSVAFVVGSQATALIDSGGLGGRLETARERGVPVRSERSFTDTLAGESPDPTTLPLATALAQTRLTRADADVLAAFDLIVISGETCRFGDAGVIRTASELLDQGRSLGDAVQTMRRARDLSPPGRHKIVLTPSGQSALQWQDGLTTLEGQGLLPLDEDHASLDDLFEGAALAEAGGELEEAARLYDLCARADRSDPIAPYNYANIRLAQGAHDEAALAYQRALARDPRFVEARYNHAQALEAAGKPDAAILELSRALDADPTYSDAVFNLAQLRLKAGEIAPAKALYERYLALDPPDSWAATARKAILLCMAQLAT